MTSKGYVNDLFRQFEKVNEKLDKANETISRLSFELSCIRQELKESNDLKKLLLEMKELKDKYLKENKVISEEEYNDFKSKYLNILYDAKEERNRH